MTDLNEQLRAVGVSRDAESPSGKGVLVSFNRAPTDDELRTLHDQLRQHGSAAQAVEPKRRDIFAICDAYESGIGHGLQRDGHKSGAIFGNPECGMAYEIGYEEGEERASGKKPNAPPVAAEQPAAAGNALTEREQKIVTFAVHRFMNAAYQQANISGQKPQLFKEGATGAFLQDAKDAEALLEKLAAPADQFCDANCTWLDHHKGCVRAAPQAAQGEGLTEEVRKLAEEMMVSNRPHHREFKVANALLTIAAHTRAAGQDWKDGERLDWMVAECAVVHEHGTRYRLYWTEHDEFQSEFYPSPRAAIDAAMQQAASNQQEGAK